MSLEQAIQENTAAIRELIAAIRELIAAPGNQKLNPAKQSGVEGSLNVVAETKARKEEAVKKSEPAPTETAVSSPVVAEPVTEPTVQETISAPLSYKEDIMPMLTKFFAKCGREAAAELLKKYGVAKFSEIADLVALSADLNAQVEA